MSWNSDAFGTTLANEDVDGDGTDFVFNLRFPGQYFDKESGEHYNYFRDYEPGTGRYLESGPIGLSGGMNTFWYVRSNSLKYMNSLGLFSTEFSTRCDNVLQFCIDRLKERSEFSSILRGGWGMRDDSRILYILELNSKLNNQVELIAKIAN